MTDTSTLPAPPPGGSLDARLVRAYLAGDRSALGSIYDRYAPGLYDTAAAMLSDRHEAADIVQDVFLLACERLGQLRDPERLKPWLYSIARHEIFRRTKKRSRNVLTAFDPDDGPEMAAADDPMGAGAQVEYGELAELVRASARGLDERDQMVLELSLRQGLQGADLAAALGVTPEQSYTLVHRMRERVEKSLGALVVARAGRKDCAALADVLKGWDGTFSVLVRKRVARHVESCQTCERTRRKAAPLALFSAAPAMALPAALRQRVLDSAGQPGAAPKRDYRWTEEGGFPTLGNTARRAALFVLGGAAAMLLGVVGGMALANRDDEVEVRAESTAPAAITAAPPAPEPTPTTESATSMASTTEAITVTVATPAPTTVPQPTVASTASTTTASTLAPTIPGTDPPRTDPPRTRPPRTDPPRTSPPRTRPPRTAPPTAPPTVPPTKPPAPGQLSLSRSSIDFGTKNTSATVSVTNVGGQPIDIGIDGGGDGFNIGFGGARLNPGQSAEFRVTFDRGNAAEGDYSAEYTVTGPNPQSLTVSASVEHRPVVDVVGADPSVDANCGLSVSVAAAVSDESPPLSVRGTISRKGVGVASFTLFDKGTWYGNVSLGLAEPGSYTVKVTATDSRGNSASASSGFTIDPCKP